VEPAGPQCQRGRDAIGVVLIKAIEGGDFTAEATKTNQKLQELLDVTPKLK